MFDIRNCLAISGFATIIVLLAGCMGSNLGSIPSPHTLHINADQCRAVETWVQAPAWPNSKGRTIGFAWEQDPVKLLNDGLDDLFFTTRSIHVYAANKDKFDIALFKALFQGDKSVPGRRRHPDGTMRVIPRAIGWCLGEDIPYESEFEEEVTPWNQSLVFSGRSVSLSWDPYHCVTGEQVEGGCIRMSTHLLTSDIGSR